jgi:hypothetical protein
MKNGIKLHTAKTGQNPTLHQRVKTIKDNEMAPAECNNVAIKDEKKKQLSIVIYVEKMHTSKCNFVSK